MQKHTQIAAVKSTGRTLMADLAESIRRNVHAELELVVSVDRPIPYSLTEKASG